jgi:hypothetical protein
MIRIKKGKHYSNKRFPVPLIGRESVHCRVTFDNTARYNLQGPDQYDINKLFGFSEGFNHHKHSARIGWNWNPQLQRIQLSAYCYVNGKRQVAMIGNIHPGQTIEARISALPGRYTFFVFADSFQEGVETAEIPRTKKGRIFGFRLNPYFGGNQPAPHDIAIELKYL